MTSKHSLYKLALDDLKHRIWMVALSIIGHFLAMPVFFLLYNRSALSAYKMTSLSRSVDEAKTILLETYQEILLQLRIPCGIILFFGALIVGLWGFRYLYSRQMVDLYHSMPVKRKHLFFIHYTVGLLIWLIPMLLNMAITLLLLCINLARTGLINHLGLFLSNMGTNILVFTLAFLTVYHFCLLCVMLCGNVFNAICLTLCGGSVISILMMLCRIYADCYLDTFAGSLWNPMETYVTSPLLNVICLLTVGYEYGTVWYMIFSILIMLFALPGALFLYLRRPSELAEHGIENRLVQHMVRICVPPTVGLAFGALMISITDLHTYNWIIFGILLGVFLSFTLSNVIMHMDFHALLKNKRELLLTMLVTCLILPMYRLDLTGYNTRLPKASDIQAVRYSSLCEEPENAWLFCEDTSDLYPFLTTLAEHMKNRENPPERTTNFTIEILKKNGSIFQRNYRLEASDLDALRQLIETDDYRESHYPFSSGLKGVPDEMSLHDTYGTFHYDDLPQVQRNAIMKAYVEDFQTHFTMDELSRGVAVCYLQMMFSPNADDPQSHIRYEYMTVYDTYTKTIETILQYYPNLILDKNQLSIQSLAIDISLYQTQNSATDVLYRYFGVAGYPDYEDPFEQDDQIPYEEITEKSYQLSIRDPEQLHALLPYLHLGYFERKNIAYLFAPQYIRLGTLTLTTGETITCYVEKGQLPKEWIDQLQQQ